MRTKKGCWNKNKFYLSLIFGFLFYILFIGSLSFISALSYSITDKRNCPAENVLMRLSDITNAHGALASETDYNYVLCSDTSREGSAFCSDKNKVLGLSSATNAHAEAPNNILPVYTGYEVCSDNLILCRLTPFNCDLNEVEVIRLSAQGNAHLGNNYTEKICCRPSLDVVQQCDLTSASWQPSGEVASGTQVKMIVNGNYLCSGLQISFQVKQGSTNIGTPVTATFGTTNATATWIANPSSSTNYSFFAWVTSNNSKNVQSLANLKVVEVPSWCSGINWCNDYNTETRCTPDPCRVSRSTVESLYRYPGFCNEPGRNCRCYWNTNTNPDSCNAAWDEDLGQPLGGTCQYTQSTTDNCDDGFLSFSWTAQWIKTDGSPGTNPSCQPGQRTIECPAQIPLPFFNIYNLLAVIIVIVVIYWLMYIKKTKKPKKKN